uniref:Uncharacterized protein n=1 Tax=Arundo donax TaxID=35708 RepID=A0A0A9E019_ARUDO
MLCFLQITQTLLKSRKGFWVPLFPRWIQTVNFVPAVLTGSPYAVCDCSLLRSL